ncbi:uncharacterized protein LOC133297923 [Gastrolobium bilobum]|uniref:uncharacterized protein LOC133297923 n=1 Tax=Gastrolobium bilobum TaxID=150636 RepID=UPI002AB1B73D|nr:uncharacterized protein LOC133297923 [Gastrolobium bilobum]
MVREHESIPTAKSELKSYLEEGVYEYHEKTHLSFDALEWWRSNSLKYKILSQMARDILGVPISTVASESTFSAGGRVIDAYRSSLAEDTIQALICDGDWLRNKYDLKKKQKDEPTSQHGREDEDKFLATLEVIMMSVTSPKNNIIWNGKLTEEFQPSRDVRQGDPISPYLFVLAMEKLSHIIDTEVNGNLWKPIRADV